MSAAILAPSRLEEGASDGRLIRTVRLRDYRMAAISLRDQLERVTDALRWHELEAEAIISCTNDGAGVLPYISDLAWALAFAERVLTPDAPRRPDQSELAAKLKALSVETNLRIRR